MSNRPSLIAYSVIQRGKAQKPFWLRMGAAWPAESGKGFTVQLDALPLDGRIVLLEPELLNVDPDRLAAEAANG